MMAAADDDNLGEQVTAEKVDSEDGAKQDDSSAKKQRPDSTDDAIARVVPAFAVWKPYK
jgi:hypothetical protein